MDLKIEKKEVPLRIDNHGVARIGGTRVTLDTVVAAFKEGATAEEIVYRYPTLKLPDVYSVLSFYLREQPHVESYLTERRRIANEIRRQNPSMFEWEGMRDRLLARHRKTG